MAMALTVTFIVCEANQASLSSASSTLALLAQQRMAFEIKRPEQKAPHGLASAQFCQQPLTYRYLPSGGTRLVDETREFAVGEALPIYWTTSLPLYPNSCESPRAPPLMDPPISC